MGIVSLAVIKLTLITLFGFSLYKKRVINDAVLHFLTFFIINFTVPFLIFSHLIEKSAIVRSYSLTLFLVISSSIFLSGYLLGLVFSLTKKSRFKNEFRSLIAFQNSGYLPLNIAFFLFG